MNINVLLIPVSLILLPAAVGFAQADGESLGRIDTGAIRLPVPRFDGKVSVEKALSTRRSIRSFADERMTLASLGQLLWAAQGITLRKEAPPTWSWGTWQGGLRTAPSAGALYPLEVYVLVGAVADLPPGIYAYSPQEHSIRRSAAGDRRAALVRAAFGQEWIGGAPCVFVIAGAEHRTAVKYKERAGRYMQIETGHVVQNICLQAVALGFGSTMVGAFDDRDVKTVVGMKDDEEPLAIVPVGTPRGGS